MVRYSCEVSLSLDEAVRRLDAQKLPYEVTHETELSFRKKPCRRAKEILTRCGFVREDDADRSPATVEAVAALAEKYHG